MSEFKIEKGILIPEKESNGPPAKWPFKNMDIGDSFFIPCSDESEQKSKSTYAARYSTRYGPMKFASRRVDGGVRIWRVE